MGPAIFAPDKIPTKLPATVDGRAQQVPLVVDSQTYHVTCVSMGNPHAVVFVDDLDALNL
jgi:diaminopimelate epimerase